MLANMTGNGDHNSETKGVTKNDVWRGITQRQSQDDQCMMETIEGCDGA